MTGKQSPDAPVGSSWLHGSGGGHGESPLYRARLVSSAVLYDATTVASSWHGRIPQMNYLCCGLGVTRGQLGVWVACNFRESAKGEVQLPRTPLLGTSVNKGDRKSTRLNSSHANI